jgi:lysozyme family protein
VEGESQVSLKPLTKRQLLRLGAGTTLATLIGSRAFADDGKLLGIKVPKEILEILPRKELNYVRIADAVIQLEREADRKDLPDSSLSRNKGQKISSYDDALYRLVLPRLVALIDRSESVDPGLADKAGSLLAEIHQTQHELPETLRQAPLGFDTLAPADVPANSITPTIALPSLDLPPDVDMPVDLPEPPVVEELPPPPPVDPAELPPLPTIDDVDKPLSKAKDFVSLSGELARMFRTLTVRPERAETVDWHLAMVRKSRERYQRVSDATGVPWHFIAVTHGLESSFNFRAHLHNGDFPLSARTRQVPAGRPKTWLPPSDWESSAKDALRLLGYTGQLDWSLERTLFRLEAYNGFGYRGLGVPTPYLWSFSNHYDRGKYVADGKFSRTARSQQCGAAVVLKQLADAGEITLVSAG